MQKKILFLTNPECDYLSDSLFHGFRSLLGAKVVDYPKALRMYKKERTVVDRLRGHGFTLYGLLDDIDVERPTQLDPATIQKDFDLVIMGDLRREWRVYASVRKALNKDNAILLDGEDAPSLYKYAGFFWRRPKLWILPGTDSIPYFKRELMPRTMVYRWYCLLPESIAARLMRFAPWGMTSFSIPEEKIVQSLPVKEKLMAAHIVDPEVAAHFSSGQTGYAFDREDLYYHDLQVSRFGITTKRAGWDCLRHYEIAANACVPCFRNLDAKPAHCAPHGLDRSNCVIYSSLGDLLRQIENMDEQSYRGLQQGALAWARRNSTAARARELLLASGHGDLLAQAGESSGEHPATAVRA